MRVERLRAGRPVHVGGVTLLPIERAVVCADGSGGLRWWSASKDPVALVVRSAGEVHAFGVDGRALDLQALVDAVAGMAAALDALRDAPGPDASAQVPQNVR